MSLHVQGEVIAAREAPVAVPALERLGPGVFAIVPGQLVRAGESPLAALPAALVWLLSCWAKRETEGWRLMRAGEDFLREAC